MYSIFCTVYRTHTINALYFSPPPSIHSPVPNCSPSVFPARLDNYNSSPVQLHLIDTIITIQLIIRAVN